jgi:hypothetical protein
MTKEVPHDLIDILTQTPGAVSDLLRGLSDLSSRVKNSPEEFSALENVCHLRDIEIEGYEVRINRILDQENPSLPDVDGSRLAIERDYNSQNLAKALQDFESARKRNTERLSSLNPEQFDRNGTMEGVGPVTIRKLIEMMREHDEDHLQELNIIHHRLHRATTN